MVYNKYEKFYIGNLANKIQIIMIEAEGQEIII